MTHRGGNLKLVLAIVLSLWYVVLPAYAYFVFLDNSDLNPSYPCIKNADEGDSMACPKKREKVLDSPFTVKYVHFEQTSALEIFDPLFGPQLPPLKSTSLILRC